jgi:glycosyltransferase involved in cell wall biosynthesis
MNAHPWLSVLIPTYNGDQYLKDTLNSILEQNERNVEYIIIDDGSTDRTLSIIKNYEDKIPIKLFERKRIGNWVANTNFALQNASGDYVCLLHQDDLWLNNRLKIIKEILNNYPDTDLLLHPSIFINDRGKKLGLWTCPLSAFPKYVDRDILIESLLIQNFISIPAPIFKREIALQVGGMNEKLWYTADWDLWLKIAFHKRDEKIIYYPYPLSAFRIHSSSQTVVRSSKTGEFYNQLNVVAHDCLDRWDVSAYRKKRIRSLAEFSIQVNTILARMAHGKGSRLELIKLLLSSFSLGFLGVYKYLRYSRIHERIIARLKANII